MNEASHGEIDTMLTSDKHTEITIATSLLIKEPAMKKLLLLVPALACFFHVLSPLDARSEISDDSRNSFHATHTSLSCTPSFTSSRVNVGPDGGSLSITVAAAEGCAWTVTYDSPVTWLQLGGMSSGSGPGVVSIKTAFNSEPTARRAKLIIKPSTLLSSKGETATVIQEKATQVASVVFDPPAATFSSPQNVTLTTGTEGAIIRVTRDGTIPSATNGEEIASGNRIGVTASMTVRAIALKPKLKDSALASASYEIKGTNPTSGYPGTQVVIRGNGFTPGSVITIGGQLPAASTYISAHEIEVAVPLFAEQGTVEPFPAGVSSIIVNGVAVGDFTVQALPNNPNPSGQVFDQALAIFQGQLDEVATSGQELVTRLKDQGAPQELLNFLSNLAAAATKGASLSPEMLQALRSEITPDRMALIERVLLAQGISSPPLAKANEIASVSSIIDVDSECGYSSGDEWLEARLASVTRSNIMKILSYIPSAGCTLGFVKSTTALALQFADINDKLKYGIIDGFRLKDTLGIGTSNKQDLAVQIRADKSDSIFGELDTVKKIDARDASSTAGNRLYDMFDLAKECSGGAASEFKALLDAVWNSIDLVNFDTITLETKGGCSGLRVSPSYIKPPDFANLYSISLDMSNGGTINYDKNSTWTSTYTSSPYMIANKYQYLGMFTESSHASLTLLPPPVLDLKPLYRSLQRIRGIRPDVPSIIWVGTLHTADTTFFPDWTAKFPTAPSWLYALPSGGSLIAPTPVEIEANTDFIDAGDYGPYELQVEAVGANRSPQTANVTVKVLDPFNITPLDVTLKAGGAVQPVTITTPIPGLIWHASTSTPWIILQNENGTAPGTLSISVDKSKLPDGGILKGVVDIVPADNQNVKPQHIFVSYIKNTNTITKFVCPGDPDMTTSNINFAGIYGGPGMYDFWYYSDNGGQQIHVWVPPTLTSSVSCSGSVNEACPYHIYYHGITVGADSTNNGNSSISIEKNDGVGGEIAGTFTLLVNSDNGSICEIEGIFDTVPIQGF
jgi:hypothetical protein